MKQLLNLCIISLVLAITTSCSAPGHFVIQNIAESNNEFKGWEVRKALDYLTSKGLNCRRTHANDTDERLKVLTDGTLNEVRTYQCSMDGKTQLGLCYNEHSLFVVSQYDMVIVGRNVGISDSGCLYDTKV